MCFRLLIILFCISGAIIGDQTRSYADPNVTISFAFDEVRELEPGEEPPSFDFPDYLMDIYVNGAKMNIQAYPSETLEFELLPGKHEIMAIAPISVVAFGYLEVGSEDHAHHTLVLRSHGMSRLIKAKLLLAEDVTGLDQTNLELSFETLDNVPVIASEIIRVRIQELEPGSLASSEHGRPISQGNYITDYVTKIGDRFSINDIDSVITTTCRTYCTGEYMVYVIAREARSNFTMSARAPFKR